MIGKLWRRMENERETSRLRLLNLLIYKDITLCLTSSGFTLEYKPSCKPQRHTVAARLHNSLIFTARSTAQLVRAHDS